MKPRLSSALDALLVLAALSTAGIAWKQYLGPPPAPAGPQPIQLKDWREQLAFDRRIGSASAPFRLAIWTDYQCPACRQLEAEVGRLRSRLGDSLSIVYRYYPLPSHALAFDAAAVAECARRGGHFEATHDRLFALRLQGDTMPLDSLAPSAGMTSTDDLRRCMKSNAIRAVVERDLSVGHALDFRGTPYVQIGNELILGGKPAEQLERLLRSASR